MFNTAPNASPMTGQSFFGPDQMPAAMTDYGALASQFMTGGQMVHMPQAQYLTAPQYGAFRSTPQSQPFPTMQVQQASLWQTYLQANFGRLPFMGQALGDYTINVYNPAMDQTRNLIMARRRLQDMQSSMFGAGMDTLPMLAALPLGGFAGIAAGFMAPSISAPYIDRLRTSRDLQNLSMSKIVGGSDMAGALGQGFTLGASRSIDRHIRGLAAQDVIFKEDDYRQLTKLGVESGMFDYAQNSEQYKNIITKLSKQVKTLAHLMESGDLNEIFENLQRMQQMGAGPDSFTNIALTSRTAARVMGMSISEAMNTHGQSGALIYGQMGLTQYQGTLSSLGHAAGITMSQRMGLIGRGELARQGGVSGLTQSTTQSEADSIQRILRMTLPGLATNNFKEIDKDTFNAFLDGSLGFDELMQKSIGTMNNTRNFVNYQGNEGRLTQEFFDGMDESQKRQFMSRLFEGFGSQYAMLGDDATQSERIQAGMRIMGWDPELARITAENWTDPKWVESQERAVEIDKRKAEVNERVQGRRERSPMGRFVAGWRTFMNEMGEVVTGVYSPHGMYEKDYEEARQLEQVSEQNYGVRVGAGSAELYSDLSNYAVTSNLKIGTRLDGVDYDASYGSLRRDRQRLGIGRDFLQAQDINNVGSGFDVLRTQYGLEGKDLVKGLGSIKSFDELSSSDGIRKVLEDAIRSSYTGKSLDSREVTQKAMSILNNKEALGAVYNIAGQGNEDLVNDTIDRSKTLDFQINNYREELNGMAAKDIIKLTSRLTGNRGGFDIAGDTDSLKELGGKDIRNFAFSSIGALMAAGHEMGTDEGHKVAERGIRDVAEFSGLDPEELIKIYRDGGTGYTDYLKSQGKSEEDATEISRLAARKGEDIDRSWQMGALVKDTKDVMAGTYAFGEKNFLEDSNAELAKFYGEGATLETFLSEIKGLDSTALMSRMPSAEVLSNNPELKALVDAITSSVKEYGSSVDASSVYSEYNISKEQERQERQKKEEKSGVDTEVKLLSTLDNLQSTINTLNETLKNQGIFSVITNRFK
jgi:hypothetical protein